MKRSIPFLVVALLCMQTGGSAVAQSARVYTDPDGAFRLKLPSGWKAERESEEGGSKTSISSDRYNGKLLILAARVPKDAKRSARLKRDLLTGMSAPYFEGWVNALKEQARVEAGKIYSTTMGGLDALRRDVTYYRGDSSDPRKGYAIFTLGEGTVIFLGLTGNAEGYAILDRIISGIEVEP